MPTIGVLFAEAAEMAPFAGLANTFHTVETNRRGNPRLSFQMGEGAAELNVCAAVCGNGKVNAASAAAFLLADEGAELLLNAGLSGAVSGLRRGQVVAGKTYLECDFDLTGLGYPPGEKPGQVWRYPGDSRLLAWTDELGLPRAALGTGDLFLADPEKKRLYRDSFAIQAFDMESAAIASVAYRAGVPFLSLRQISDDADDTAGKAYRDMNDHQPPALADALFHLLYKALRNQPFQ